MAEPADPVPAPAGSPVEEGDLIIPSAATDLCGAVLAMIQSISVARADLDYRVDEDNGNLPTTEFANQIGAMIFPPGTIMAFNIAVGTSDNAALKIEVEKLWKKADGSEVADAPWWVLCDGSTGVPDLIHRFIMGAGTKGTGEDMVVVPVGLAGGSNTITIGVESLPNHNHKLGAWGNEHNPGLGVSCFAMEPMAPEAVTGTWHWTFSKDATEDANRVVANYTVKTGAVHESLPAPADTAPDAGKGKEIDSRPAFIALVYAMRTTRMS